MMEKYLLCLMIAVTIVTVEALVVVREGRRLVLKEQEVSKCEVELNSSGRINGVEACHEAYDDPTKYPNLADWNFRYSNTQTFPLWLNVQYTVDTEDSKGCERDRLAFGGSKDPERVVLCGKRSGSFSIPIGPGDTFTIHFKSDYSVAGRGFVLNYGIGRRQVFRVFQESEPSNNNDEDTQNISPTRTQISGRSDSNQYEYPEYADNSQYPHYQYFTYPEYPDYSQYLENYPDYYHNYQGYPTHADSYNQGYYYGPSGPQNNYQYQHRQFARPPRQ